MASSSSRLVLVCAALAVLAAPARAAGKPKRGREVFEAANLTWQREPSPKDLNWRDAKATCARLALSGGGWRLPTKEELEALYAAKRASAVIAAHPGMDQGFYWSSSPSVGSEGHAWDVVGDGSSYAASATNGNPVRCVRR